MALGDLATWFGAISTAAAGTFAGWQLMLLRRQEAAKRYAERAGVAVSWRAPIVPRGADAEGLAIWRYEFTAHNPSRLPIRDVNVEVAFPCDVRRLHRDGHVGAAARSLKLGTPVLVGGMTRTWKRAVRLPYDSRRDLRNMEATISFVDMDGHRHVNTWSSVQSRVTGAACAQEERAEVDADLVIG